MYPQFVLRAHPRVGVWWDGWLMPFASRPLRRFRIVIGYRNTPEDPLSWVVEPEISRRTWPCHRHLYANGTICPRYPDDDDWKFGREDVSHYADLIVLWLGCQIHLEENGWWPGPESPTAERHGPVTFRSEGGQVERAARAFVERAGFKQLQQLMPAHGVPPGLCD